MSTQASTAEYILDQLTDLGNVAVRKMFGEYALYYNKKVVGLICDNTLFIKITPHGKDFVGKEYVEGFAYKGAKASMKINEDLIEQRERLCELVALTFDSLSNA